MKPWLAFVLELEKELGKEAVDQWVRTLDIVDFDSGNLHLEAKDPFQLSWFKEHIGKKNLSWNGRKIKLHVSLKRLPLAAPQEATPLDEYPSDQIDSQMTFDNFIVTPTNQLAFKLTQSIEHSPTVIYGPSGSGKTHLLMAAANALSTKYAVRYVRGDTFTQHVVRAIRASQMSSFRSIYRNVECLIVDGIDILSGKNATQEEFFHTFNILHLEGKGILLSSPLSPKSLEGIEPRLISRFEWGLAIGLEPLDHAGRERLLHHLLERASLSLPAHALSFLLDTFTSPPLLKQAVDTLIYAKRLGSLHFSTLPTTLAHVIERQKLHGITPEKIIETVAKALESSVEEITSKGQTKKIAFIRQLAMFLLRKRLHLPYVKIAELFNRDHSTVMSSVKGIESALAEGNAEISIAIQAIDKLYQGN